MSMIKPAALCGALALAALVATADSAPRDEAVAARKLQALDVFGLEYAADPQISPDGRRIVYVRMGFDIRSDRVRASLWSVDADGSNHRPLRADRQSSSSPRWSPDGTRIAYASSAEGSPQLFVRWMDSGQTALITDLTEAPDQLAWSPDGRWLAFTMFVPKEQKPLAEPPPAPEGAQWAPAFTVIDHLTYRIDGEGYLKSGFTHLFVAPADGGAARQLTYGDFNDGGPLSFSPDGRTLLFSANRNADWEYDAVESEVFAVDVASGALRALTSRKGPDYNPVFSPDGKRIAYLGYDDRGKTYQTSRLTLMDAGGSGSHELMPRFDEDVFDPHWSADGRSLYFMRDERGVRKVASVTLDGRMRDVATGLGSGDLGRPYTGGSYSISRNGAVAYTASPSDRPADVALAADGAARTLTSLNDDLLGHKQLGALQELTWQSSHDGRDIQGWLLTPPGFDPDRKYPLILEIHGGPHAAYGPTFATELQRYAAAGYVVLYANPRGSTSYGEAFTAAIHHAYPGHDYDDLMTGVDAAIAKGFIDERNLFVTGGSGGGILTAWIVGKTDRFRAAVSAKPIINFTSMMFTTDFTNSFVPFWFAKPPWEDPSDYWRRSPLSLVGNVKTPTMLLTAEQDFRTPISEAEQFYAALKLRKIDTVLVRVPEASHDIVDRPSRLIAKTDTILAWFAKYRTDTQAAAEAEE
ncbi:MAG TPA: S9 family peptidase [Myxococcota bacterium]|jgi:dipeptidyl aminopeptidase/acylaminoacyl peptidase